MAKRRARAAQGRARGASGRGLGNILRTGETFHNTKEKLRKFEKAYKTFFDGAKAVMDGVRAGTTPASGGRRAPGVRRPVGGSEPEPYKPYSYRFGDVTRTIINAVRDARKAKAHLDNSAAQRGSTGVGPAGATPSRAYGRGLEVVTGRPPRNPAAALQEDRVSGPVWSPGRAGR